MALLGGHYLSGLMETSKCYTNNFPSTLIRPSCLPRMWTSFDLFYKQKSQIKIRCSLSREKEALSPLEFEDSDSLEGEEFSHVIKFKFSDFKISDRVSIGLGGRVCKYINSIYLSFYLSVCLSVCWIGRDICGD